LWLGASLPTSAPGWLSLAFLALGPGAVAAVAQSDSMPRLGPPTYAIIANCELVTVVLFGATVLGEKLTLDERLGRRADPDRHPAARVGAQITAESNCHRPSRRAR
jgi:drug/metabolite transporter (DMT)-like permease